MPPRKLLPITAAGSREIAGQPLTEVPTPPAWMGAVARRKFEEIAGYLVGLRAVTFGEVALIEAYAACYGRWAQAEEQLSNGDPGWRTVLSRQGTPGTSVPTPAMLQSQRSVEQLRKLGAALGLTPVDRAKLPAGASGGEPDPMDELFEQAGYGTGRGRAGGA